MFKRSQVLGMQRNPVNPTSYSQPVAKRVGVQQRLKDIEDALASIKAPSTTQPGVHSQKAETRPGREQRLKDIQDALAGKAVASEPLYSISTTPRIMKRPSSCEPPPVAKRRRLEVVPELRPPVLKSAAIQTQCTDITRSSVLSFYTSTYTKKNQPDVIKHSEPPPSRNVKHAAERAVSVFSSKQSPHVANVSEESPRQGAEINHLKTFFARYPGFEYNPRSPPTAEFRRMVSVLDWKPKSAIRNKAHRLFKDTMALQFNRAYGTNEKDINGWQVLCNAIGVDPIPETLKECQDVVMNTHVNIVDLVSRDPKQRKLKPVKVFESEKALSQYTIETKKFFPGENVKAGGLLKMLLRRILNPPAPSYRREFRRA